MQHTLAPQNGHSAARARLCSVRGYDLVATGSAWNAPMEIAVNSFGFMTETTKRPARPLGGNST